MTAAPLDRYASQSMSADMRRVYQLRAAGYRVVADDRGGVWLVGRRGCQWFENVLAAYQSVRRGTGALVEIERR